MSWFSKGDYTIYGTGDPVLDTAGLQAIATKVNATGKHQVVNLSGMVAYNQRISFDHVSLVACDKDSGLRQHAGGTISIGQQTHAINLAKQSLDPTTAGSATFTAPGTSYVPGDWVYIGAENPYSGVTDHLTESWPGELLQIKDVQAGVYIFDDYIIDQMNVNQFSSLGPMRDRCSIEGLRLEKEDELIEDYMFELWWMNDWKIEDNHLVNPARFDLLLTPGIFRALYCANGVGEGNVLEAGQDNASNGAYGFAFVGGNSNIIRSNHFWGFRHAYTCGAVSIGSARVGVTKHQLVEGNNIHNGGDFVTGLASLETHPESYNTVFKGNLITLSGQSNGIGTGIELGGRHDKAIGNVITGNSIARAIYVSADDCEVTGNTIDGAWRGVVTGAGVSPAKFTADRLSVSLNKFKNLSGEAFQQVLDHDNLRFERNVLENVGYLTNLASPVYGTLLTFTGGSGHKVIGNSLSKYANERSIAPGAATDIQIEDNNMTGYGLYSMGLDPTATPSSGLEEKYRRRNTLDCEDLGGTLNSINGFNPIYATENDAMTDANLPIGSPFYVQTASGAKQQFYK